MDVSKEAIDKILELAQPEPFTSDPKGGDYQYLITHKQQDVKLLQPKMAESMAIATLTSLVDLLETAYDSLDFAAILIHVSSPDTVLVQQSASDDFARFREYFKASRVQGSTSFQFGAYMSQEAFVIGLRTQFVQTNELDALIGLAGNLAAKTELKQEDDGFTQTATMKGGVHMVAEKVIKPRVTLQPFRTFLEAEQPGGDFIFRVKVGNDGSSMCALFEADGGNWKLAAMQNVKTWLKNRLKTSTVDGLGDIPIIC